MTTTRTASPSPARWAATITAGVAAVALLGAGVAAGRTSTPSAPVVVLQEAPSSSSLPSTPAELVEAPAAAVEAPTPPPTPAPAPDAAVETSPPAPAPVVVVAPKVRLEPPAAVEAAPVAEPPATVDPPAPAVEASPQTTTTAPAPAANPDEVVWIRLAGQGYCSQTARGNLAPGVVPDPTCPAGQPAPRYSPKAPAPVIIRAADGTCVATDAGTAARMGQPAGDPTCPPRS